MKFKLYENQYYLGTGRYSFNFNIYQQKFFQVDEGYFVHFFAPTTLEPLHKHVLFVLDVSGSMEGRSIEQLRQALDLILSDIGEGDYFSILTFSTGVEVWNKLLVYDILFGDEHTLTELSDFNSTLLPLYSLDSLSYLYIYKYLKLYTDDSH